jgi:aspartate-semialdehyde dehydrogenase
VELGAPAALAEVRAALTAAPGIAVVDQPADELFPDTMMSMEHDEVLLGRLRQDAARPGCIQFWLSADNLRKGSALNMVQIAELWLKEK